jgi:hypothetical protein
MFNPKFLRYGISGNKKSQYSLQVLVMVSASHIHLDDQQLVINSQRQETGLWIDKSARNNQLNGAYHHNMKRPLCYAE